MSRRRKSTPKAVVVPVVAAVDPSPAPVEVKAEVEAKSKDVRPVASCYRCGRTGAGKLCPRCSVVLGHSGQKEARLYVVPVNPMIGY